MKKCPSCNAIMEDDALFCGECGTKFEVEEVADQVEETIAPQEKKCIHCGETIEEDSAFCPYCGKSQTVEVTKRERKEHKPRSVVEKRDKPINENALEESIGSMINAHRQRYQEEGDKTVRSILKPKLYPNANIQLFSDTNQQSVLKIQFNTADDRDVELNERLKANQYYKLFARDEAESNAVSLFLDFHNDEKLASKVILEILMTVYNQPQECAISYVNNVSGYTMQERGIDNSSSGCSIWTWLTLLVIVSFVVWLFFF